MQLNTEDLLCWPRHALRDWLHCPQPSVGMASYRDIFSYPYGWAPDWRWISDQLDIDEQLAADILSEMPSFDDVYQEAIFIRKKIKQRAAQ